MKNKLVKVYKLAYYAFILSIGVVIYYSQTLGDIVNAETTSNENGVLLNTFNSIAKFFEHATMWNLIFLLVAVSSSLLIYTILFEIFNWSFKSVIKKWPTIFKMKTETLIGLITPIGALFILFIVLVFVSNGAIKWSGANGTIQKLSDIPEKQQVLLLGTSKMLSSGKGENLYYRYRINTVDSLYRNGKISQIVISGDKAQDRDYDETKDMKNDLIALGVPAEIITLDTAGYRTQDSILRGKYIYKMNQFIIVSQKFHTERAVMLSKLYGIEAYAFNAPGTQTGKMLIREVAAKPKVLLDMFIFNTQPKVTDVNGEVFEINEAFVVSSDRHVIMLIVLFMFCISSFVATIKVLKL